MTINEPLRFDRSKHSFGIAFIAGLSVPTFRVPTPLNSLEIDFVSFIMTDLPLGRENIHISYLSILDMSTSVLIFVCNNQLFVSIV